MAYNPEPEQLDRENRVMELRRLGLTWQEIAEQVGYATHVGAWKAYKRVMERYQKEPREDLQNMEVERLNRIMATFMHKALIEENEKAAQIALRAIEIRSKLLGLNEPTKIQSEVITWDGDESIDRSVRELAALLQANASSGTSEDSMGEDSSETIATSSSNELEELVDSIGSRLGQDENRSGVAGLASDFTI